jgi:hypothetical protein
LQRPQQGDGFALPIAGSAIGVGLKGLGGLPTLRKRKGRYNAYLRGRKPAGVKSSPKRVGWKSQSFSERRVKCMEKIASNLKVGLKFETDNVRQRGRVGEIAPSVARPTLTHKQRRRGETTCKRKKGACLS